MLAVLTVIGVPIVGLVSALGGVTIGLLARFVMARHGAYRGRPGRLDEGPPRGQPTTGASPR